LYIKKSLRLVGAKGYPCATGARVGGGAAPLKGGTPGIKTRRGTGGCPGIPIKMNGRSRGRLFEPGARFLDTPWDHGYNFHVFLEVEHEKDVPAEYQKKEKEPRVQKKDEHKVRKGYYKEEEAKRQEEVERLSTPHGCP